MFAIRKQPINDSRKRDVFLLRVQVGSAPSVHSLSGDGTDSLLLSASAGMVRVPPPQWPPTAEPEIRQEFEGHGLAVATPHNRGFERGRERPASAATLARKKGERPMPAERPSGSRKDKDKEPPPQPIKLHVHVRDKVVQVNAGQGLQCIYWLGLSAVNRYLFQPLSYSSQFSSELTPKRMLSSDGSILKPTHRICDELADGDHVWLDVGDGAQPSSVSSRSFPERQLFDVEAGGDCQEHIAWGELRPEELDDELQEPDHRPAMRYTRTVVASQPPFKEWQASRPPAQASSDTGQYQVFQAAWKPLEVRLDDMPDSSSWMKEVQGALWRNFECLQFVFATRAVSGELTAEGEPVYTMPLLEFWALCKRCAIPTPWCNLARIDTLLDVTDRKHKLHPHNPSRGLTLSDFLEILCRVSIVRQEGAATVEPLPDCLSSMIEEYLLRLAPGFEEENEAAAAAAEEAGEDPTPFRQVPSETPGILASPALRQKLTIHDTKLKKLFYKWATADERHEVISLSEWFEMFEASGLMGADLTRAQLLSVFVHAMLGDHDKVVEKFEDAVERETRPCQDLIFSEFVEALTRTALSKYADDASTPVDLKVHEICLLLISGPAGAGTGSALPASRGGPGGGR